MRVTSSILMCSLLLAPCVVYGGEGHDHNHEAALESAPHGGMLRDSPPFKTELVLNKDEAKIYIYDKDLKPIATTRLAQKVTGQLAFPKEREKREVVFNLVNDSYTGVIAGIGAVHRYDLHVSLFVDGKEVIGDFGVDNIH